MKKVATYKGMAIKETTKRDISPGDEWRIGDLTVFNEDDMEEYSGVGSMKEAKELIDGLLKDRKKRSW